MVRSTSGRLTVLSAVLCLTLLLAAKSRTTASAASFARRAPRSNKILIRFPRNVNRQGIPPSDDTFTTDVKSLGLRHKGSVGTVGYQLVEIDDGGDPDDKLLRLKQRYPGAIIEPDQVVRALTEPNDGGWNLQWNMQKISAPAAWNIVTTSTVTVCIIDTGIDYTHPDLKANMHPSIGFNALTNTAGNPMDDNGHGTHCAGIIGAVGNNSIGLAGVAWKIQLLGCKFMDVNGDGLVSNAIRCLQYCREQGASITSNSWGGDTASEALLAELRAEWNAGNLFVVAAGNNASNNDVSPVYPANLRLANIISVAATNSSDELAPFSNYGSAVDLGAPGVDIVSTVPEFLFRSGYGRDSGTSQAAPLVAGAAALVWAVAPQLLPDQVAALILSSVDPLPSLSGGKVASGGRLNLTRTLLAALELQPPLPPGATSRPASQPPSSPPPTRPPAGANPQSPPPPATPGKSSSFNGTSSQGDDSSGIEPWIVAIIVLGSVTGLFLLGLAICIATRRTSKIHTKYNSPEENNTPQAGLPAAAVVKTQSRPV